MPAEPGTTFGSFGRPTLNQDGAIAFSAAVSPGLNCCGSNGIWIAQHGAVSTVARSFTPVPGGATGDYFGNLRFIPRINAAGRVAFLDAADFPGYGILRTNARGPIEIVAATRSPAPGLGAGINFYDIRVPAINARGDVLFHAVLTGNSVTGANDESLWRFRDGILSLIAREGDHPPGTANGVVFGSLSAGNWPVVSGDSADVAFYASLRGPDIDSSNQGSIWRFHDQNLQLIARAGIPAPDFAAGSQFTSFGLPIMNALGQLAFRASIQGPDGSVDGGTHNGIWAEGSNGILRLIVRDGDTVDVDPGPGTAFRTIAGMNLVDSLSIAINRAVARGVSDQPFAFNDLGQVAFAATFIDSSRAIIVSNKLLVPEPIVWPLMIVGGVLLRFVTARRCRRMT